LNNVIVTVGLSVNLLDKKEEEFSNYADSINNYSGGEIPSFFHNLCIDWQRSFWQGLHSPMSIRWYIISKVTNKEALGKLIATNVESLHEICSMQRDEALSLPLPMIELSYYELLVKRYNELP